MSLFQPVPDSPNPKASYSPTREADALSSLQSTIDVLQAMIAEFEKFTLTSFTDADGNVWQALLIANGQITTNTKASPFDFIPTTSGKGKVSLYSQLSFDFSNPATNIAITGLDTEIELSDGDHVWLEIDVTPMTDPDDPEPPTASIEHGRTWGGAVFPQRFEYDTDDGTPGGSGGSTPPKQTRVFIPIGYAVNPDSDPFAPLAKQYGIPLSGTLSFVRQLQSHLVITGNCYNQSTGIDAVPWWGPQPPAED